MRADGPRPRSGARDGAVPDRRAVSTAVSYVLGLGITALLITGLLIAAGGLVDGRRAVTSGNALEVTGQRLAAGLMTADRLADTEGAENVSVEVSVPPRIAGSGYEVRVNGSTSTLVLEGDQFEGIRRVPFVNHTAVETTTVRGGDVRVVLNDAGKLEVREA